MEGDDTELRLARLEDLMERRPVMVCKCRVEGLVCWIDVLVLTDLSSFSFELSISFVCLPFPTRQ